MSKKARVLLLSPNLKGMENGLNRIQPPLGLMLSAAVMRDQGHHVKVHDAALEGWNNRIPINRSMVMIGQSEEELITLISDFSPDIVGISALFSNLMESAHNIASIIKKVNRNITVVLGGNHISSAIRDYKLSKTSLDPLFPAQLIDLDDKNIDYAMYGEVDYEFPKLVTSLVNKMDLTDIRGLVFKNHIENKIYIADTPDTISNLDGLPFPARDLVNMEGYFDIGAFHSPKSRSKRVLSVMA